MELTRFIELSEKHSKLPLPKNVWDTLEHEEYMDAFYTLKNRKKEWRDENN